MTEAERNYETMRMATREVQAAMERAAGELLRERELADALGRALEAAQGRLGYHLSDLCGVPPCWCGLDAARDAIDEALRQWREARKPDTGTPGG